MGVGNGGTWVGEIAKGHRETVDSLRSMTGVLRSLTDSIGADVARGRENLIPGGRIATVFIHTYLSFTTVATYDDKL